MNRKIATEMHYAGGNNWVLEWTFEGDLCDKYLRMSDDSFVASRKSFEQVTNGEDDIIAYYREIGANSILDIDIYNDLNDKGYLEDFQAMCNEWHEYDKKATVWSNFKETIYTTYVEADDRTIIWKDVTRQIGHDDDWVSTELIGWYFGEPGDDLTAMYTGKLKAECL